MSAPTATTRWWRRLTRRLLPWCLALLFAGVAVLDATLGPWRPLQGLEWASDDLRQRQRAAQPSATHPDIVIVDIDEASLDRLGRWPWPRQQLASLTRELFERQGVAALGFDLVFPEPDDGGAAALLQLAAPGTPAHTLIEALRPRLAGDAPLAAAFQGHRVVLGWYLTSDRGGTRQGQAPEPAATVPGQASTPGLPRWSGHAANLPLLAAAATRQGAFNALADDDGLVRSVPAVLRLDDGLHESLSLALWRVAVGNPALTVQWREHAGGLQPAALQYHGADGTTQVWRPDAQGALRVPYRGRAGPQGGRFRYVSAARLIQGELRPGELRDHLVLVGSSAPGLADLRATPIHPAMPGVEVHAQVLAGLLDGSITQRPDWAPAYGVLLTVGLLATLTAVALALPVPAALASALLVLAGVAVGTVWAEQGRGWWLPIAVPALLATLQFLLVMSLQQVLEWQRRRRVERLFSSYLPPERVRQLVRNPEATQALAEHRELSVLFCDLQGFSGLAEQLPPMALRDLLNRFFTEATAVVQTEDGTLDKFIGDAVMAFWGAPLPQTDHAARALRAAVALADAAGPLNEALRGQGLPPLRYGVGLATGWVCVGDLGSQLRRSYTAVGDAVNLAARLEALTRETGLPVLLDEATRAQAAAALPGWQWWELDVVQVRGRSQPVTVFTPLRPSAAQAPEFEAQLRIWQLALQAERQHDAQGAAQCLIDLEPWLSGPRQRTALPALRQLVQRLKDRLPPPVHE